MPIQEKESRHWFVLTTFDPKDSEEQLCRENVRRDGAGLSVFKFVVPTQLLKRRVSREWSEDFDYAQVSVDIDDLVAIARQFNDMETVRKMKEIVPEYKSNNSKYDVLDKK